MSNGPEVPPGPPSTKGSSNRAVGYGALALLAIAGAAVGFYFIGRSSADTGAARREGRQQGEALYAKGTPRYQRIYNTGYQAGQIAGLRAGRAQGRRQGAESGTKLGLDKGRQIGTLQGERKGIAAGAKAALGGFTDWQTGAFYIVRFAIGAQGVPFRIDSRKLMAGNLRYAICSSDPSSVCTERIGG
jgi:hypothetical protein